MDPVQTTNMNIYARITMRIIKEQELIIGPLAWEEATRVPGLTIVDKIRGEVSIQGNEKEILSNLVARYKKLFGRASDEVCKEAASDLIAELPIEQIPDNLK
jgi:hypothetical protein